MIQVSLKIVWDMILNSRYLSDTLSNFMTQHSNDFLRYLLIKQILPFRN